MGKARKLQFMQDLGFVNDEKRIIKKGSLYRTSFLGKLKNKSIVTLHEKYDIRRVIDLRSPSELLDAKEELIDSMEYYHLPPLSDLDNPAINRHNRMKVLKALTQEEGGTKGHIERIYCKLISTAQATKAYAQFLRILIENPNPNTIWHCTQGKDRTGIASMILLLALGVDKETIIQDYLAYNKSCKVKNALIFIGVSTLKFSISLAKELNYLLTAQRSYIESAFNEIERVYHSIDNYLSEALLLTKEDIKILRDNYLVQVKA